MIRFIICILLCAGCTLALAESSHVEGSGQLSASARIDFRIIIPPKCWIDEEGNIQNNFSRNSNYRCQLDDNKESLKSSGTLTIASP